MEKQVFLWGIGLEKENQNEQNYFYMYMLNNKPMKVILVSSTF